MIRCLLIEDDVFARDDLRRLIAGRADLEIVGETGKFALARELLARPDYDLVFLDVELIGGNGLHLVPYLRPGAKIIFTTAYDRFAVRAFEINALDYLLKPIVSARLAQALARAGAAAPAEEPPAPGQPLRVDDTVYLRAGNRARFAPVADLSLITAEDNYTSVTLVSGERLLIRRPLDTWESMLPATHFLRIHRQHIANLARVAGYDRNRAEHTQVALGGVPAPVPVSRRAWPEVRARLAALRPGA